MADPYNRHFGELRSTFAQTSLGSEEVEGLWDLLTQLHELDAERYHDEVLPYISARSTFWLDHPVQICPPLDKWRARMKLAPCCWFTIDLGGFWLEPAKLVEEFESYDKVIMTRVIEIQLAYSFANDDVAQTLSRLKCATNLERIDLTETMTTQVGFSAITCSEHLPEGIELLGEPYEERPLIIRRAPPPDDALPIEIDHDLTEDEVQQVLAVTHTQAQRYLDKMADEWCGWSFPDSFVMSGDYYVQSLEDHGERDVRGQICRKISIMCHFLDKLGEDYLGSDVEVTRPKGASEFEGLSICESVI